MGLSIGAKSIIIASISLVVVGSGFVGIFFVNNVVFRGEVVYLDFEGGFYGIISNDDKHYDPINLPEEFKVTGLEVFVIARIRDNYASFHMWGRIIEIRHIKIL
jgi:hypothetical protein